MSSLSVKNPTEVIIQSAYKSHSTRAVSPYALSKSRTNPSSPQVSTSDTTEWTASYITILDTTTGYPVKNNLYSVTIISDSSCDGDALSTTCFALGIDKAKELINSLSGVEAIFVTDDYSIITTSDEYNVSKE